ncbi:MAG TPA: RNA polymerase sigma factor [Candidatus Wallbacteria bacterium]|nr:RNA polymerase sigma factor [Candidatus Wallbacteria bacterium]
MNVIEMSITNEKEEGLYDFDLIYSKYYVRLSYFIKNSIGGSYEDAENIAQETFMIFFQKLSGTGKVNVVFEDEKSAVSYIYQIARNLIQNHNRKSYFRKMVDNIYLFFQNSSVEIEKYDEAELKTDFDMALARLPETYREVITLKYISELSVEQISKIMGISEGTVKSRFFNGSARMAKILKEYRNGNGIEKKADCNG